MKNHSYLNSLPTEFLQLIASFLPCSSALQFLAVSRKINRACDDWIVWREVTKNDPDFSFKIPSHVNETKDIYKVLAIANEKTYSSRLNNNIHQWPPRFIMYHHQAVSSIDPAFLCLLSNPAIHEKEVISSFSIEYDEGEFKVNPSIPYDVDALRAAQASSYCLAVRLLSLPLALENGAPYSLGSQQPFLHSVEWFKIAVSPYRPHDDLERLVPMLHTAANKVVGFFSVELRSALADRRVVYNNTTGLALPPTAFDIPFNSLMINPPLVRGRENTFESFSPCHLPIMARPEFFVESEWTGYFSHTGERGFRPSQGAHRVDYFDGIGGDNVDIQTKGYDQPNSSYPFRVERTVRFRLVHWINDDVFFLQSNYFQSQTSAQMLEMKVNRQTGTVDIVHHSLNARQGTCHAVITPFGVVEGCLPRGVWLWLWKIDWCAQS